MRSPLGRDALNAVARACPDIAVDIDAEAVRNAGRDFGDARGSCRACRPRPRRRGCGGASPGSARSRNRRCREVSRRAKRRGRSGRRKSSDDDAQRAVARIEAIDVAASDLALRLAALVGRADAVSRIGEPNRAVRLHHHVVRRIEALALVAVGEDRDGPVIFGAGHPPAAMLAGDETALPVAGVAVGEIRVGARKMVT